MPANDLEQKDKGKAHQRVFSQYNALRMKSPSQNADLMIDQQQDRGTAMTEMVYKRKTSGKDLSNERSKSGNRSKSDNNKLNIQSNGTSAEQIAITPVLDSTNNDVRSSMEFLNKKMML